GGGAHARRARAVTAPADGFWLRLVRGYAVLSYRRPLIPLSVIAVLFIASTWLSGKLRIDMDLRVLLPNGTPSKISLETAEKRMGSTDFFTIAFQAADAEGVARFQKAVAEA